MKEEKTESTTHSKGKYYSVKLLSQLNVWVRYKYISYLDHPKEFKHRARDTAMQKKQGDGHSGSR